ncbi:MAG: carboxylating nicotinate-nucleotide diphosphorylase [Promethearchaeota archaeon]
MEDHHRVIMNNPFALPKIILLQQLRGFLALDVASGDLSSGMIPITAGHATISTKSSGILAGAEEAALLFEDNGIEVEQNLYDGAAITAGMAIFQLRGNLRDILMVERTALDFLMKLSSIATSTADFVAQIRPISPTLRLATTRKTTPGFGWFEKKAVFLGGGDTHRWNLSDMVMFKDTHLKFYGDPLKLLTAAKKVVSFSKKIEIEIEKPEDIPLAIQGGADIIMLDNMTPSQIQTVLEPLKKEHPQILFEASGNITLDNIESYANSGVDIVSTSAVVFYPHKPMDFSLRLQD